MSLRILTAEDDATSRAVLNGVLKKEGYNVTSTVDGAEAWSALQLPDAPRLAILDWMMPGIDGPDVVRLLRAHQNPWSTYIIMLTTKAEEADIVMGLDAGANDYLTKPFNPRELRARVEVGRRMIELQDVLAARVAELTQALEDIKTLHGILPICASCKKIRDDQGYWNQVEDYIHAHTEASFSHAICPGCEKKLYPEYCDNIPGVEETTTK